MIIPSTHSVNYEREVCNYCGIATDFALQTRTFKIQRKKIEKNILPVAVRNKNEKKSTFRPVHSTPFIISWNLIK